MALRTFMGGIRPRDGKELSRDKAIRLILPDKELVYPLAQHDGDTPQPCVAVGDKVLVGQKIADLANLSETDADLAADAQSCVPLHASVSGKVAAIEKRLLAAQMMDCIVIENDGLYDEIEYSVPSPLSEMDNAAIIDRIRDGGVVGMSGSAFPTHLKLAVPNPEKIAFIIINAIECELYYTTDHRLLLEEGQRLIEGIHVLLKLFPYARGIIAIADNKPDAIALLKSATAKEQRIGVRELQSKFPQGEERQLILSTTGRMLSAQSDLSAAGCMVINAETVIAICRSVIEGKNIISRVITVSGDAICAPQCFSVRFGTSFDTLIKEAGGFVGAKQPAKILRGGPMSGQVMTDTSLPVTKTDTALICLGRDDVASALPLSCINCGRCTEVCFKRLQPAKLAAFAEHGDEASFFDYMGGECCGCGCCSYVCPSKRYLSQMIMALLLRKLKPQHDDTESTENTENAENTENTGNPA